MLLLIIKVLALLFTVLVIVKSYLAYRQRQESLIMFLFWSATWIGVIAVAFYPDLVTTVLGTRKVGVGTLLGIALVFVYFVTYRVYVKADRLEKKMHDIVRELALKDLSNAKKSKKK